MFVFYYSLRAASHINLLLYLDSLYSPHHGKRQTRQQIAQCAWVALGMQLVHFTQTERPHFTSTNTITQSTSTHILLLLLDKMHYMYICVTPRQASNICSIYTMLCVCRECPCCLLLHCVWFIPWRLHSNMCEADPDGF